MQFFLTLLIVAAVFGVCYLVDKGFAKLFRSKAQHMSGLAVRAAKRYGLFGLILSILGILGICIGATGKTWLLIVGGVIVLGMGAALAVYYLSFGIFYDGESFLVSRFAKKSLTYYFKDITGQKLYLLTGGNIMVELYMADGTTVAVQSTMDGAFPFLDTAFAGWCVATGTDPRDCDFYDPSQSHWFPTVEDL